MGDDSCATDFRLLMCERGSVQGMIAAMRKRPRNAYDVKVIPGHGAVESG